jgi:hypothetical protein
MWACGALQALLLFQLSTRSTSMNKTMTKTLWAATAAVAFSLPAQAVTIVQWDFEGTTTPADLIDSATSPSVPASLGTGTALGVHAAATTDWTTPAGNGSANAFSSNGWAVGDYYQFSFSTLGFTDLLLSVDQIGSGTGPRDFSLSYSTDGVSFTPFASYNVLSAPAWGTATYQPVHTYSFDLSSVSALDDQSSVVIRLSSVSTVSISGGTVAAAGTGRVDNFTAMMTPVPEAGTAAMLAAGLAVVGFVARRRRA